MLKVSNIKNIDYTERKRKGDSMFFYIQPSSKIVVQQTTRAYTYAQLVEDVQALKTQLEAPKKGIVVLQCRNDYETIVRYVASLQSGHAVMLMNDPIEQEMLESIVATYEPLFLLGGIEVDGYEAVSNALYKRIGKQSYDVHEDVALLLSTSGTTGNPKYVKLSYRNIQANAESIVTYLNITERERPLLNLPLSYSYGISIVNSHLLAGATLLLTSKSVKLPSFWYFLKQFEATSIAGVPFTYQMMSRLGFLNMTFPSLHTMTQAGGHLDVHLVDRFCQYAVANQQQFYVMYGQTEASPRMAYVPPERLPDKLGTIGIPVPGGRFDIDENGELIYYGDNVMMGYATNKDDLARGDELRGCLRTGDVATMDEEGYVTLVGRLKSFIKIKGLRINLHDVEKRIAKKFNVTIACVGKDGQIVAIVESGNSERIAHYICQHYNLHPNTVHVAVVEELPHFHTGKLDYKTLRENYLT